ncbi:3'-5' exonuclease [uncultured Intestinimonas sp.]|uniref:3'-5' exonuclease n=1 Tax=uncultured Intestinimonas sp. TaxID=1689265 RepID=UPI0025D105AE|nr:3'-5' exonuclease [uncultured Intestinimonas sp.]
MLLIDFEWNRGYDNKPLDEILQIGAVRVSQLGGPILDTFNAYIRPQVHKRFGPGAKVLPELECSRTSELDFATALSAFLDWCGGETEFAAWGGDDFRVLQQNCDYWGLPVPLLHQTYDLQRAFGYLVGAQGQQVALWRAAAYCGIPDTFTFHNALNDAVYTAAVSEWLSEESLRYVPDPADSRKKLPRFSEEPFPAQPRFRVGPLPSPEAVLDARPARRPACPLCGQRAWVQQWQRASRRQYLAVFSCPAHGRFLCRMTLTPMEDGAWRGRVAVPPLTPDLLEAYRAALSGRIHVCKGSSRRRRKVRRRKRQACASPTV